MDPQGSDYAQSKNGTAQTANNSGTRFLPSGTTTTSGSTYDDIDFLDYSGLGTSVRMTTRHVRVAEAVRRLRQPVHDRRVGDRLPGHRGVDAVDRR